MAARLSDAPERLTAFFSGHVQGVGFRFTVLDLVSESPELTGTVRNLSDGRVEMVAEGPRNALDRLLGAVQQQMRPYISQTEVRREPATGEFAGFNISR